MALHKLFATVLLAALLALGKASTDAFTYNFTTVANGGGTTVCAQAADPLDNFKNFIAYTIKAKDYKCDKLST